MILNNIKTKQIIIVITNEIKNSLKISFLKFLKFDFSLKTDFIKNWMKNIE